jgi:hypothetical protein
MIATDDFQQSEVEQEALGAIEDFHAAGDARKIDRLASSLALGPRRCT